MGKRGPKNTPSAVKLASGTYRKHRDADTMELPDGTPSKPAWLGGVGAEVWDEVLGELSHLPPGVLAVVDGKALSAYCLAWQRLHEAREKIDAEGVTSFGSNGNEIIHPAIRVEQAAIAQIERLGARFGLTPADRASMKLQPQKKEGVARRERSAS